MHMHSVVSCSVKTAECIQLVLVKGDSVGLSYTMF